MVSEYSLTNPTRVRQHREIHDRHHAGWIQFEPGESRPDPLQAALPWYALEDRDFNRRLEYIRLDQLRLATTVWLDRNPHKATSIIDTAIAIHDLQSRLTYGFTIGFDAPAEPRAYPADVSAEAETLRIKGKTLPEIAYRLDLCCPDVVHDVLLTKIDGRLHEPIQQRRALFAEALDARQFEIWPEATDLYPNPGAIREAIKIIRLRTRLLDLTPKPPRTQQTPAPRCQTQQRTRFPR